MGDTERSFFNPFSREATVRERLRDERVRLPHGAVPLDPHRAIYPSHDDEREPYTTASTRHIHERLINNSLDALESGVLVGDYRARQQLILAMEFTDYDHPERLPIVPDAPEKETMVLKQIIDFAATSLYAAQIERIEYHAKHPLNHIRHAHSRRVRAAKEGLATPHELFTILSDNPSLESIELAKLSHPFDINATTAMEADIQNLFERQGKRFTPSNKPMRTKIKRIDTDIPACVAVTKQPLGVILLPNGRKLEVIRRRGRLVRGDEAMWPYIEKPINRLITNENRRDELLTLINDTLAYADYTPWLLPLTTSMYADYLKQ